MLTWPKEYGGQGLGRLENVIFNQEEARFKTPPPIYGIGHGMLGPTLMTHGTKEQKERYVKEMARGQVVWCQLFSEPAAGSDLAGPALHRGARRRRLDPQRPEDLEHRRALLRLGHDRRAHRPERCRSTTGLTYFIVDMKAKGVEIRPIKQINGGSGFNEVFFNDVRVPDSQRLGGVGDGWKVSITTLMNERVAIGAGAEREPHPRPLQARARVPPQREARDRGQRGAAEARRRLHHLEGPPVHELSHPLGALAGRDARARGLDQQGGGRAVRPAALGVRARAPGRDGRTPRPGA